MGHEDLYHAGTLQKYFMHIKYSWIGRKLDCIMEEIIMEEIIFYPPGVL